MAEGEGLEGVFPPLAKTGRLTDKAKLVKVVLQGMSGPITVNGKQYDLEMIPVSLSDEEVRDVLNYVRNSWDNKAPAINLAEVKKFRDKK
jgi:nitrite reductase (NO-forming)